MAGTLTGAEGVSWVGIGVGFVKGEVVPFGAPTGEGVAGSCLVTVREGSSAQAEVDR